MVRFKEMALRTFHSFSDADNYAKKNYKPKTTIDEFGIYWMIIGHEENQYNVNKVYDERPALVVKIKDGNLNSDEIFAYRITDELTGQIDRCHLDDWGDKNTENLKAESEIKLNYKAKVKKDWIGDKIGDISDRDYISLAYADKNYNS